MAKKRRIGSQIMGRWALVLWGELEGNRRRTTLYLNSNMSDDLGTWVYSGMRMGDGPSLSREKESLGGY